jgi:hypothetical protein
MLESEAGRRIDRGDVARWISRNNGLFEKSVIGVLAGPDGQCTGLIPSFLAVRTSTPAPASALSDGSVAGAESPARRVLLAVSSNCGVNLRGGLLALPS